MDYGLWTMDFSPPALYGLWTVDYGLFDPCPPWTMNWPLSYNTTI